MNARARRQQPVLVLVGMCAAVLVAMRDPATLTFGLPLSDLAGLCARSLPSGAAARGAADDA